jgi:hypothetical protein
MTALRKRMLEDMRIRNFTPTTQKTYVACVSAFARHFGKPPDQLGLKATSNNPLLGAIL